MISKMWERRFQEDLSTDSNLSTTEYSHRASLYQPVRWIQNTSIMIPCCSCVRPKTENRRFRSPWDYVTLAFVVHPSYTSASHNIKFTFGRPSLQYFRQLKNQSESIYMKLCVNKDTSVRVRVRVTLRWLNFVTSYASALKINPVDFSIVCSEALIHLRGGG